jgi:hypothetical protein
MTYEFNKLKIEGAFSNLSKHINKFSAALTENKINSIDSSQMFNENSTFKEKLNIIIEKTNSYFQGIDQFK